MLSFSTILDATVVSNFSQGSGPIFVTQLECGGDEMSILECPFDLDTSDCSHSNDAGVQCYGMLELSFNPDCTGRILGFEAIQTLCC